MNYIVYYNCPCCKNPCTTRWNEEANEIVYAKNKTEAREMFQAFKMCRNMKVTRIERYCD